MLCLLPFVLNWSSALLKSPQSDATLQSLMIRIINYNMCQICGFLLPLLCSFSLISVASKKISTQQPWGSTTFGARISHIIQFQPQTKCGFSILPTTANVFLKLHMYHGKCNRSREVQFHSRSQINSKCRIQEVTYLVCNVLCTSCHLII